MATQKNLKSKATASKPKSPKVASVKKPVSKTPAKAKPVLSKGKSSAKTTQAAKSKPNTATKAKSPVKAPAKPLAKPVAKKATPNAPVKGSKTAPPTNGKTSQAKSAKPVASKQPTSKPTVKTKSASVSMSTKPAPKVILKVKATSRPTPSTPIQPVAKKIETPVAKVVLKAKAPEQIKQQPKEVLAKNPLPAVINVVDQKKSQPKPMVSKSVSPAQSKTENKSPGSTISDHATKRSVSAKTADEKPEDQENEKEHLTKSPKPISVQSGKSIDKMAEKKENKPASATAYAEEPQKSRYNDKELEEFDQLIDLKLIVAREQLEFYLKQLEDMAENPDNKIKGLDDGLSTLESERVSSMAARQQKLIQHLENAKIRIKNKVYGICRETGKLISKERLRAAPHATLSIEAKQAQH